MQILESGVRRQRTISSEVSVQGVGYWSDKDVVVTFRPGREDTGIQFVREDLDPVVRIPAGVEQRIEIPRRTVLSVGGKNVEMVEHLLAALAGLNIDNCEVGVSQPEIPGCDGSALAFVNALQSVDIVEQEALRGKLVVVEPIRVADDDSWIEARPVPAGKPPRFKVQYRLDYGINHIIGRQTYRAKVAPQVFCEEIASARTFLLKEEADWLKQQGLGKRTTYQDLLVFADPEGVIDNELRFEDECVRHKVLDMIGDFALAGFDLVGDFVAHRSGHRLNANLMKALLAEGRVIQGDELLSLKS